MIIGTYSSYSTLADYLPVLLKAYPTVEDALDKVTVQSTVEHQTFHRLSLQDHVPCMWIRQGGLTWQLNRASNIRGTAGYSRYVKTLMHEDPLQEDERNIAYRYFMEKWEPWVTVPL